MFCGPFICWGGLPHDCHNLVSVLLLPKLSTSGCPDLLGSKVFGLRIPPFRILFVMLGQISLILTKLLQRLSEKPKSGIGSIFGNIFVKKKRLLARLLGIQKALAISPNLFLVNLDKQLQGELNKVLNHEEELWAMKSRINWMIQGDRNTSFYHVSTLIRRKHNKILNIKDGQGEWIF